MAEIQRVKVIPLDIDTLIFNGTVAANSKVTLVSQRLIFPFVTKEFRVHFALNTNKTLRVSFYISPDDSAPVVQPLTGHSVFSTLGQVDYVVGDDETVIIPYHILIPDIGIFIKVFADNTDSYEHSIDAQVFITRDIEVRGAMQKAKG